MQSTLPPPFLDHKDAYLSMGFHRQHAADTLISETDDECLLQLCLYAQARSKGRQWSMHAVHSKGFDISHLNVEFHTHCEYSMGIGFVINLNAQETGGFYWLNIHTFSAYCRTMAEALHAINAIAKYLPVLNRRRIDTLNRMRFQSYVCRSMEIMANNQSDETLQDHIPINAMRRKLGDDDHNLFIEK